MSINSKQNELLFFVKKKKTNTITYGFYHIKTHMKNKKNHRWIMMLAGLWSMVGIFFISFQETAQAAVPNEYIANYEISAAYEKVLGTFVEIDAYSKLWEGISQEKFKELHQNFIKIFPKFPQDYSFRVTFQQCTLITEKLWSTPNTDSAYKTNFASFMSNCYKPFSDVLKRVNAEFTVAANAVAKPTAWSAPLTVTFDARMSMDPSNQTIPSNNFFWYYRDVSGEDRTIGVWPVIKHTFEKEGNYIIHLTVRSSNKSRWILDGDQILSVDVSPKSAIIHMHANGQKMEKETKVKVWTLEATRGVVFDPTSTIAMGGRQITSHTRDISSSDGFKYTKTILGKPDVIRVSLPGKWEYKVSLTVTDNETNTSSESFNLIASDPVAVIKQNPEKGNTSTVFNFDGSPSYSVVSSLKLYTREIFNQKGDKIETYQGKDIKQKFKEPGFYTIKLTVEDSLWQRNIDTIQAYIESTEPLPQFIITPAKERLHPSRFVFDASISSDIDKNNGNDTLSYERIFPETAKVNIIANENNNEKITVEFNKVGKFLWKLIVKDKYGKMAEIEKEVEIKSILRPEIIASPLATSWWNTMNFTVKSNQPIAFYERNFDDGDQRSIQSNIISHVYKKAKNYNVKLRVSGNDGSFNEITKMVFVGEKDYPIAAYVIYDKLNIILTQNEKCEETDPKTGKKSEYPSYQIERYQEFKVNPSWSVNTKWESADLQFYFQPKNKEIYKQPEFSHKFDEIGCNYIDFTTEDTKIWKNTTTRIWFKVVNALPKLDNLVLFFPQYGNEVGVGFNENQVKDIFNSNFDPLIVKVSAVNPIDPDGFISYYKRYYYPKDDPTRYIETKITPSDIPYTFFSLPKIPGEYSFGVTMYDNDTGRRSSQELIGNGPIVFFPPDSSRPDIPIVTLRTSSSSLKIGEEVTFDVIAKIISDRPDFIKERTIYYDFDGDGIRDLVTKKDRVTYTYTKASGQDWFTPRAAVLYRGFKGVSNGAKIIVNKDLKPMLLFAALDNFVIFRDISLGDISKKRVCPDIKKCSEKTAIVTWQVFSYTYPGSGRYIASIDITDQHANEAKKILPITIKTTTSKTKNFEFLSIPEATLSKRGIELFVGNNLDNTIVFYIKHNANLWPCYIDENINHDSNGNGNDFDDADFQCNTIYLKKYEPKYDSTIGRIYYSDRTRKLVSQDFTIGFIDFEVALSPEDKKIYDQISALIKELYEKERESGSNKTFKDMLKWLRDNLFDKQATPSNVVGLKDFIEKNPLNLTQEEDEMLKNIFLELSSKSIAAAEWLWSYGIAKEDILSILPNENAKTQINNLFKEFETVVGDQSQNISQQDKRKEILKKIVNEIIKYIAPEGTKATKDQITKADMDEIIIPNMCKIMSIYTIPSDLCGISDIKEVPEGLPVEIGSKTSPSKNRLKIIFIILGIVVVWFIAVVVVFAIKAKTRQEEEQQEQDENQQPQT
jgi:PKD repeat protein